MKSTLKKSKKDTSDLGENDFLTPNLRFLSLRQHDMTSAAGGTRLSEKRVSPFLPTMSSSASGPSTPFEWLSGGLFFGNRGDKASDIDNCKDVMTLLRGSVQSASALFPDNNNNNNNNSSAAASPQHEQEQKLLAARLRRLRFLLYEERRQSSQSDSNHRRPNVAGKTMEGLVGAVQSDASIKTLVPTLLNHLCLIPFESRKDVAAIFNYLLLCGLEGSDAGLYVPTMRGFRDFVESSFDAILDPIVRAHDCLSQGGSPPDVVLHCGSMYRSCLQHVNLYRQLVQTPARVQRYVFPFLDAFVHSPDFDVASDALESLKLVLTGKLNTTTTTTSTTTNTSNNNNNNNNNEDSNDETTQRAMWAITAEFLNRDYQPIWDERFTPKLLAAADHNNSNYIKRRMALQILSTVLLTRSNYEIMIRYVASKSNLKNIMLLLRDTSPHITLDAFHVFKIFVANPQKPPEIVRILSDNKEKLSKYLETLHKDKEVNDKQFRDEKALVIRTIQGL